MIQLFFLFTCVSSVFARLRSEWAQFTTFQDRFNKKYDSVEELNLRFQLFITNIRAISHHNSDFNQNFTMGMNQFTDLSPSEFKTMYASGFNGPVSKSGCSTFTSSASNAPIEINWTEKGAVTSVKDQGQCGSCWAFSATGAIESAWAISKGELLNFSEQELVDCATGLKYRNHGCNGGLMDSAFNYVMDNGQCLDDSYPYTSGVSKTSGDCQKCSAVAKITSCSDVKPNDQISLKGAVYLKPVSVAISADTVLFQSYSSGVITSASCYTSLDHGVLIVGYGEENGLKYWLVKNSWGESWGDAGYVKIGRSESTDDAGVCGIGMQPSFPSV